MFDVFGMVGLLLLVSFGTWLVLKARRARSRVVKWGGLVLSSVFTLACAAGTVTALIGFYRINSPPQRPAIREVKVAGTPEQVARGAKLAAICAACHSPNGKVPLVGTDFLANGPPFGVMYAANLTPAGEIKDWSDGEIIRAIREGVHKSGRALIVMPSENFRYLSDDDVQSIVAYLRLQPATGPGTPPTKLNVLGGLVIGLGMAPTSAQPPSTQPVVAPAEGSSAEYGKYLVSIVGCRTCHGENLAGRKPVQIGPPAGPNLTAIVPRWSAEEFIRTFRTGVDPYKHTLLPTMPWKEVSAFASDEDLTAIHAYLHGLTLVDKPLK